MGAVWVVTAAGVVTDSVRKSTNLRCIRKNKDPGTQNETKQKYGVTRPEHKYITTKTNLEVFYVSKFTIEFDMMEPAVMQGFDYRCFVVQIPEATAHNLLQSNEWWRLEKKDAGR